MLSISSPFRRFLVIYSVLRIIRYLSDIQTGISVLFKVNRFEQEYKQNQQYKGKHR